MGQDKGRNGYCGRYLQVLPDDYGRYPGGGSVSGLLAGGRLRSRPGDGQTGCGFSLGRAIVFYILSLAAVFILALIINALAPTFSSRPDQIHSLKLAAYSLAPYYLAGIFYLFRCCPFWPCWPDFTACMSCTWGLRPV